MPQSAAAKERRPSSSSSPLQARDATTTPPRGVPRHVQHSPALSVTPPPQHAQRQNVIQTNPSASFINGGSNSAWSALVDVASSAPSMDVGKHHDNPRYAIEYAQAQAQQGSIRAHQNKWSQQQQQLQRPNESKSPYHQGFPNNLRHIVNNKDMNNKPPPSKSPGTNGPTAANILDSIIVNTLKSDVNNDRHAQNAKPYKPKKVAYERVEAAASNNIVILNAGKFFMADIVYC